MKFYYDFLEKVCGKVNLETAVFKVRFWLLPGPGSPTALTLPACGLPGPGQLLGQARAAVLSVLPASGPPLPSASAITRMFHNLPVPPLQVPWLLDMVVSRVAAVASLTLSGRVVVFPE